MKKIYYCELLVISGVIKAVRFYMKLVHYQINPIKRILFVWRVITRTLWVTIRLLSETNDRLEFVEVTLSAHCT